MAHNRLTKVRVNPKRILKKTFETYEKEGVTPRYFGMSRETFNWIYHLYSWHGNDMEGYSLYQGKVFFDNRIPFREAYIYYDWVAEN